jgi:protoporphyrinogen/coproporphyrinogen III oxidase
MAEPYYQIAIVGGGITGLVAAYTLQKHLQQQDHPARILLLEAAPCLGGKIQSIEFAGTTVDTGAEAFVAQAGRQLCIDLDLENQLLAPLSSQTNIWTRGRIRPLPGGLAMGIPTNPLPIAQSGILSPFGLLRAGLDLLLPRTKLPPDPTIAQVIGSRLGSDLLNHLVEPLIGGIHAGRADRLSLAAVAPQLASAAQNQRSLILGLRPKKSSQNLPIKSAVPQLLTFEKGLTTLIERLQQSLSNVDIRTNISLSTLHRNEDGSYQLLCENGEALSAASVVLATPASNTSTILQQLLPEISSKLRQIEHASVMVTHLAYHLSALPTGRLQGTGFLVPRANGKLMNACTCINNKWPRQSSSDLLIFRCSAGRAGDDRAAAMSDEELSHTLHQELVEALGLREQPVQTHIARWPSAFPQYISGYQARIKQMEQVLSERTPGLFLAGAPYHGLGLASCIKDGSQVARNVLDYLEPSLEHARYQNRIIPGP